MRKPIICQLSDFSPEYPGSFVDSLLYLARYCKERMQIETLCLFPERAKDRKWLRFFDQEGILYGFVPRKRQIVFSVPKLLQGYDPLIFHSHFFTFDVAALLIKLIVYRNAKIFLHFHSLAPLTHSQRIKDAIKVRILAQTLGDRFIAVGEGVFHNGLDRGFPRERLVLVQNGIDTRRFCSDENDRKQTRASLGVSDQQTIFLLLGYDPYIKGVDYFVKAAQTYAQSNNRRNLFLVIGRKETREYVAKMPESRELGSSLRVMDPTEDFAAFLNGIDILVSSSRSEGLSYAVLEAMSEGKLILYSDIPGLRETCKSAEGAWFFPLGDWQALSSLMKTVDDLPSVERERLGNLNARYAGEHFSLETWANRVGDIYRALLSS